MVAPEPAECMLADAKTLCAQRASLAQRQKLDHAAYASMLWQHLLLRRSLECQITPAPTYEALHRLGNGHGQDELYHPLSIAPGRHSHRFILVHISMKLADSLFIAQSDLVEVLQAENSGGCPRALLSCCHHAGSASVPSLGQAETLEGIEDGAVYDQRNSPGWCSQG